MTGDSSPAPSPLPGPIGLPLALLEELRPIARRLGLSGGLTGPTTGRYAGRDLIAIVSGVGRRHARRVATQLIEEHGCRSLLSIGFGGGLDPALPLAAARVVHDVVDEEGQRHPADVDLVECWGEPAVVCLTVRQALATPAAKAAAWQTTGAHVVDMETWAVAQVAIEHGVPWCGIRAISDPADTALPRFIADHVDPETGQLHLFRMFGYLLPRPQTWAELVRLARDSKRAADSLAAATAHLLERTA